MGRPEKASRGPTVASASHPVVSVPDRFIIGAMKREVGAELEVEITAPTTLEFQIAVAPHPNTEVFESLSFVLDGKPVQPLEISGVHGNRIHKLDVPVGNLTLDYAATIVGQTDPAQRTAGESGTTGALSRYETRSGRRDRSRNHRAYHAGVPDCRCSASAH